MSLTPAERLERINSLLAGTFSPSQCQVIDESAMHAGHAGAASGAGHYRVIIVSTIFTGRNRLARHRLVYDCLRDLMQSDIHAMAITALAPNEVPENFPAGADSGPEQ